MYRTSVLLTHRILILETVSDLGKNPNSDTIFLSNLEQGIFFILIFLFTKYLLVSTCRKAGTGQM
jgi:hypothetical protein